MVSMFNDDEKENCYDVSDSQSFGRGDLTQVACTTLSHKDSLFFQLRAVHKDSYDFITEFLTIPTYYKNYSKLLITSYRHATSDAPESFSGYCTVEYDHCFVSRTKYLTRGIHRAWYSKSTGPEINRGELN